jgi:hypothetical protein
MYKVQAAGLTSCLWSGFSGLLLEVSYSYSYMALASTSYLAPSASTSELAPLAPTPNPGQVLVVVLAAAGLVHVLLGAGGDQRGSADTNSLIGRSALSPPWRLVEVGRKVERQQRKVMVRLGQEREASSGS